MQFCILSPHNRWVSRDSVSLFLYQCIRTWDSASCLYIKLGCHITLWCPNIMFYLSIQKYNERDLFQNSFTTHCFLTANVLLHCCFNTTQPVLILKVPIRVQFLRWHAILVCVHVTVKVTLFWCSQGMNVELLFFLQGSYFSFQVLGKGYRQLMKKEHSLKHFLRASWCVIFGCTWHCPFFFSLLGSLLTV